MGPRFSELNKVRVIWQQFGKYEGYVVASQIRDGKWISRPRPAKLAGESPLRFGRLLSSEPANVSKEKCALESELGNTFALTTRWLKTPRRPPFLLCCDKANLAWYGLAHWHFGMELQSLGRCSLPSRHAGPRSPQALRCQLSDRGDQCDILPLAERCDVSLLAQTTALRFPDERQSSAVSHSQ
jgi:hypothetical protein